MNILKSRAFWTAVADAVFSLIVLAIGLARPELKELTIQIVGLVQPIVMLLIAAFTVEGTVRLWAEVKMKELSAQFGQKFTLDN